MRVFGFVALVAAMFLLSVIIATALLVSGNVIAAVVVMVIGGVTNPIVGFGYLDRQ